MADSLIAVTGADFVMVACDTTHTRCVRRRQRWRQQRLSDAHSSIMVVKEAGEDKIMELDSHKLVRAVASCVCAAFVSLTRTARRTACCLCVRSVVLPFFFFFVFSVSPWRRAAQWRRLTAHFCMRSG